MKAQVLLILAAILLIPIAARAQAESAKIKSTETQVLRPPAHERSTEDMAIMKEYGKSGGSPGSYMVYEQSGMFLDPEWSPGYVVLKDKSILDGIQLRYDLYHQQMQFIQDEDTLAFSNPSELDYIYIGDRKFIYSDYVSEKVVHNSYFEVLHEGECPLYVRHSVRYHLDPEDKPSLATDIYVRECIYYVRKSGQEAQPIRANRKSILCVFNDREEEVAKFMDDNKLRGKTCEELKLVIAFYNSLH